MRLEQLRINHVRRVASVEMRPSPHLNVIVGPNGSGKTSLLESIHILASGRSFRSRRFREVVSRGSEELLVFGEVVGRDGIKSAVGIERKPGGARIRVNGEDVRTTSRLARLLPVVFIGPDCLRLLTDGSELRRKLLDWVVFHVEHDYLAALGRYQRALRQRNRVLREGALVRDLEVWEEQMAVSGRLVHQFRVAHAGALSEFASSFLKSLLPLGIELDYEPGWDSTLDLEEALRQSRPSDLRVGHTRVGPHRADLLITTGGRRAGGVLSRGESRLLTMGLHLAQAAYFAEQRAETPILMVDDLGNELDEHSCRRFFKALLGIGAQTFVTSVVEQIDQFAGDGVAEPGSEYRKFHVEQGQFTQVV